MGPKDRDQLEATYQTMNQRGAVRPGGVGVGLGALGVEQARDDRVVVDPFAGLKAGENREFRGFNANQVGLPGGGGMTVISGPQASGIALANQLMTQGMTADQAIKLVGVGAEADLNNVKGRLLPAEAAAQNELLRQQSLLTGANTGYRNVETDWYGRKAGADVAESSARTKYLGKQSQYYGPVAEAGVGLTNAQANEIGSFIKLRDTQTATPSRIYSDELGIEVDPLTGAPRRRGLGLR